jgi:hypothetical protein
MFGNPEISSNFAFGNPELYLSGISSFITEKIEYKTLKY